MSRAADPDAPFIGINWGSTNFRAYRIAADGTLLDMQEAAAGVTVLDRSGMAKQVAACVAHWSHRGAVYASGMIGSNVGWLEAPYAEAPTTLAQLAAATVATQIGDVAVTIVPGIACRRTADDAPDILRGEEIELFGLAASTEHGDGLVALPGTHTKWVRFADGCVVDFLTSMSGEMFDRLTAQGLLASIVAGEAAPGAAFDDGLAAGAADAPGLAAQLFGARARVIRGELARGDAASYIRGVLIGAELAGARALYPQLAHRPIALVGNAALSTLYAAALARIGISSTHHTSHDACIHGFTALHRISTAG